MSFSGTINGNPVSVERGDITKIPAGAIIVPQWSDEADCDGVRGALLDSGANKGVDAFVAYVTTNGPLPFGTVLLVEAGQSFISSKYLLHVVSIGGKNKHAYDTVKTSMFNALTLAAREGVTSITSPALGTGAVDRLTGGQSASAMLGAIYEHRLQGGKVIPVSFIVRDKEHYDPFVSLLSSKDYFSAVHSAGSVAIAEPEDLPTPTAPRGKAYRGREAATNLSNS